MKESQLRGLGIAVTLLVHLGVMGGVWGMGILDRRHVARRVAALQDDGFVSIEAGLAIRASSAAGRKTSLPSKKGTVKQQSAEASGVARNLEESRVSEAKKTTEEIDPEAVFNKYRQVQTDEVGENTGGKGEDPEERAGAEDGSEWGTLEEAKGDPYVAELVGRMTTNPELVVPSLVADTGLLTLGCVRLDSAGKIIERTVDAEHKSRNATFNRAVAQRLKQTSEMEKPVPEHLHELLVKRGICVPYRY
ncbi:MAG: hypothetical protein V2A73_19635 [Pseudomonadota bacterium]